MSTSNADPGTVPTCYRHGDRETYIRCQRCDRPICPECMQQASVGFQCPNCVAEGQASVRTPRTMYGGTVRGRDNIVTLSLIGLNVGVFFLVFVGGPLGDRLVFELAMISGETPPGFPPRTFGVANGEFWRLLTAAFLHQRLFHVGLNMLALWIFGPMLERVLGRWRFLALYLLGALSGSTLVYLLADPQASTLGASGAVFALLGAALVVSIKLKYDVRTLLILLGINLAISFVPGISWQGHFGGLLGGLAMGWALAYAPRNKRTLVQLVAFGGVLLLCVVGVVAQTLAIASPG